MGAFVDNFMLSVISFLLSIDNLALSNIIDDINGDIFVPPDILLLILFYNKYLNTIQIAIIVDIKFNNIINRINGIK